VLIPLTADGFISLLLIPDTSPHMFDKKIKCQMSKTFISGAVCREFESKAPAVEEMLDRVVYSREQFSFQMRLESGDGSGTFCN